MQAKSLFPLSSSARLMFVALTATAIGLGATLAQAQPGPHGAGAGRHAMHGDGGPMMGGGRMLERMLDGVDASAEQRTRIRDIMKAAATDVRAQREASRGLREQAMALFAQPTVDARAVEALRQQMLQQHDQSSKRWTQAMLDASAVLTPEQRKQMAERMKQRRDMMERHQRERRSMGQG